MDLVAVLRAAGCVFAEDEARILQDEAPDGLLDEWTRRRVAGEPLEYIVGFAQFHGLRVLVDPGVFVPRVRTEAMVDAAITRLGGGVLLDLCCGSGAVAAAVRHAVPGADVYASDIDARAVACSRRNLQGCQVFQGDLFGAVPTRLRGRIRVITANTPYVPSAAVVTMPPEARDHEPRVTLDGGSDGLDVQRRVAAQAPEWLAHGGSLLVEVSDEQVDAACTAFSDAGLTPRIVRDDDRDAMIVVATV